MRNAPLISETDDQSQEACVFESQRAQEQSPQSRHAVPAQPLLVRGCLPKLELKQKPVVMYTVLEIPGLKFQLRKGGRKVKKPPDNQPAYSPCCWGMSHV